MYFEIILLILFYMFMRELNLIQLGNDVIVAVPVDVVVVVTYCVYLFVFKIKFCC